MVLVDTSVWIRFLANEAPYAAELDRLLAINVVVAHPFVFGELLIGDQGNRTPLLLNYEQLQQARVVPHLEIVDFVRHRGLSGQGIGWVDTHLLGAAFVEHGRLWTADRRLATLAQKLGIAYEIP